MKVGIVGAGHVGLPTAGAFARVGHEVVVTDVDHEKIALLERGAMPFFEPGLEELLREGILAKRISFTSDTGEAVAGAPVVFICVGTPPRRDGEANLAAVERSAEDVARYASEPLVVVEKSTVPFGTGDRVRETMRRVRPDLEFQVVCNPEFLREGSAVEDSLRPGRILVGTSSAEARDAMRQLYEPFVEAGATWIETDIATAEIAKHASNAFLALKVSYANALARICELAGADVLKVADIMGADPRIGRAHLTAGLGYGGSCFPKDLAAFDRLSRRLGYEFPILAEVARINEEIIDETFRKIEAALWNLEEKRVALLGLAFKPGTDDVRFAPALALAQRLLDAGVSVVGYDPQAAAGAKAEVPAMELAGDPYSALDGAHCAVLCTEWPELRALDPDTFVAAGFTYVPLGRPTLAPSRT
ncbi:MAG TPA: UDP-glucose/GDP-mannose dehydrogenase family protein [Actinomycetota bacterium]|nr:UDP-glucose/GDP-mannose dehydrogenase family protein [Actinomycetota bacterium]